MDKRVLDCLKTEIDRTGAAKILYKLTGPNSNSVVYTLLVKCEIPAQNLLIVHLVGADYMILLFLVATKLVYNVSESRLTICDYIDNHCGQFEQQQRWWQLEGLEKEEERK